MSIGAGTAASADFEAASDYFLGTWTKRVKL